MNRPGDWTCKSCQYLNFSRRDSCQRCGEIGRGGFSGADVKPGDWYCSACNCGVHNFANRSSCFKCGAFKDESGLSFDADAPRSKGGFGASWKSGDWICARSGCNKHNFANRMECYRCNAPRDSTDQSS
ncbi:RNA-binding protein involved in heterochromatin assembly dri1-like [Tasmannia lanceolata]|uniref:RNA-binding protein involved in heterochromatin assembly dri1-like n=1 Tax=Tasmannia lanceolata TaxID=3420 RepID=UPI00406407B3